MEFAESFIKQEDQPDYPSHRYNFLQINPPNTDRAQVGNSGRDVETNNRWRYILSSFGCLMQVWSWLFSLPLMWLKLQAIKMLGLLQHLPLALQKQNMEFVKSFIEQDDQPTNLVMDITSRKLTCQTQAGHKCPGQTRRPWHESRRLETLLCDASYQDNSRMHYHNSIFLHIGEHLIANWPLVPYHQKWLWKELCLQDKKLVLPYFFNSWWQ